MAASNASDNAPVNLAGGGPDPMLHAHVAEQLDALFPEQSELRAGAVDAPTAQAAPVRQRLTSRVNRKPSRAAIGAVGAAVLCVLGAGAWMTRPFDAPPAEASPDPGAPPPYGVYLKPTNLELRGSVQPDATPVTVETSRPAPKSVKLKSTGYSDVLAADRQLRQAYRNAIRSGVPHATLVDVRDQWASERRRSRRDPRGLVLRYGDLRARLDAAASRRSFQLARG